MQAGQKFLDFLRKWRKNQSPIKYEETKAVKPADFFVTKNPDKALNMIVARHLGHEAENDRDEASAQEWQSKLSRWEKEVMGILDGSIVRIRTGQRDHFNLEASPAAHINRFISRKKRLEPDPDRLMNKPWFAQAVTAGAFALVLAIALAKMNLGLVRQINSYTDRLFVDPVISAAFLFGGQETLAKIGIAEVPERYRTPAVERTIDKNVLASFIVNNSRHLKIGNASEAAFVIPAESLDGRVAGAYEAGSNQPSTGLVAISVPPRAIDLIQAEVGQALLDLANLQIKASDRVYEWLTKK